MDETSTIPRFPYGPVYRRGVLVSQRFVRVCDCHEVCAALVWADGPLAGRDLDTDHTPQHADDDLRDFHAEVKNADQCDGYRVGGRW